jgi:hypothetical protein
MIVWVRRKQIGDKVQPTLDRVRYQGRMYRRRTVEGNGWKACWWMTEDLDLLPWPVYVAAYEQVTGKKATQNLVTWAGATYDAACEAVSDTA